MNRQLLVKINLNGVTVMAVSYDISENAQMEKCGVVLGEAIANSNGTEKGIVLAVTNSILLKNGGFYGMSQKERNEEMVRLFERYKIRVHNNNSVHEHKNGLLIFRPETIFYAEKNCDYLGIIECFENESLDYAEAVHVCSRLDPSSEDFTCVCAGDPLIGRRIFLNQ